MLLNDLHPFYLDLLRHIAKDSEISSKHIYSSRKNNAKPKEKPIENMFIRLLLRLLSSEKYKLQSLGFEYGEKLDLASAGIIGQAVMSAPTMDVSLQLICRYYKLTGVRIDFDFHYDGKQAILKPIMQYENIDARIHIFILETFMSSWTKCNDLLIGKRPYITRINLNYEPPLYADTYKPFFGQEVQFNSPSALFAMNSCDLKVPTITGNSFVHKRSVEQCEFVIDHLNRKVSLKEKTQNFLRKQPNLEHINIETLSKSLHISSSTIIRRLKSEGHRFQSILDKERYARACKLLTSSDWKLEKIAEHLGYSDSSNFRRAFKKWSGTTPKQHKKNKSNQPLAIQKLTQQ